MSITGILHPGAMGAAIAGACAGRVVWSSDGRSPETRARAEARRLEDVGSLAAVAEVSDVILSVCPPGAALDVATEVARTGFEGVYVDANAVSPATVRQVSAGFARFVDGGIVGPPPADPGTTRLYLSGDEAAAVASLFAGSAVETIDLGPEIGRASALKMAYAAWTKGSGSLLVSVRAMAAAAGVEDELRAEWRRSLPGLEDRFARSAVGAARKGWRFEAELQQIAATFEAFGLPGGAHEAAAEIFGRLAGLKGVDGLEPDDVIAALLAVDDGPV